MKNLKDILNEGLMNENDYINESEEVNDEVFEKLQKKLPELAKEIGSAMGIKNIKLEAELYRGKVKVESENLLPHLKDDLWKIMFKELIFETWGGNITKEGLVWLNPKFSYQMPTGGSNGHDFGAYHAIYFDPEKEEFIYR